MKECTYTEFSMATMVAVLQISQHSGMPAEILLGQIGSTTEDREVQEVLRQVRTL